MTTPTTPEPKDFNYCFWAKLIVAIPAIPLIALMAAAPFSDMTMQVIAAGAAIAASIWLAIKIDRMPCLLRKVNPK
jgi:hypothetical protein